MRLAGCHLFFEVASQETMDRCCRYLNSASSGSRNRPDHIFNHVTSFNRSSQFTIVSVQGAAIDSGDPEKSLQGLKPRGHSGTLCGTAEAVPCYKTPV